MKYTVAESTFVHQQWVFPKLFREQEQGTTCSRSEVLWEQ